MSLNVFIKSYYIWLHYIIYNTLRNRIIGSVNVFTDFGENMKKTNINIPRIMRMRTSVSKPEDVALKSRVIHLFYTCDLRCNSLTARATQRRQTTNLTAFVSMLALRWHAVRSKTFIFFFTSLFPSGAQPGCWWVWSLLQIVVQLFWTSSWLALAKLSLSWRCCPSWFSLRSSVLTPRSSPTGPLWQTHVVLTTVKKTLPWLYR